MLNSSKHASYKTSMIGCNQEKSHFSNTRENLAKTERWVTNIHEHKRYYYTFDNSLLFTEAFKTLHKSFHAKS